MVNLDTLVTYRSLRVAVEQLRCEGGRCLPPTRLGPLSLEASHLDVDRHLRSPGTAETAHVPKRAPQLSIRPFQEGSGAHHFPHDPFQSRVADGLLKLVLERSNSLRVCGSPLLSTGSQQRLCFWCAVSLINGPRVLQELLFILTMQPTALVTDMAQRVEDAALLDQARARDVIQGLLQPFRPIMHKSLESRFQLHATLPQALHQSFPGSLVLLLGYLPIQDVPFAAPICPQAQGDQHHHALAPFLVPLAALLVDGGLLRLHAQPDAIELHHRWPSADRFVMNLGQPDFELIDALIDGASSHACP